MKLLIVGCGGFLGAASRYGVGLVIKNHLGHSIIVPTLIVNVLGCLAIGILFELFQKTDPLASHLLFLSVGFLGAFTTFSAFGFETIELLKPGQTHLALINIGANLLLCLGAVALGMWLGSFWNPA